MLLAGNRFYVMTFCPLLKYVGRSAVIPLEGSSDTEMSRLTETFYLRSPQNTQQPPH